MTEKKRQKEGLLKAEIHKKLGAFSLDAAFETDWGCLGILGPSGCGKSMTLKSIAGIVKPDQGRITLGDRVLYDGAAHIDMPPRKRRVGYLFQNYALFPNMTVEQNIAAGLGGLPGRFQKARPETEAQVARMVTKFHLEGLEKRYPRQLSGGQQQRAALARILAYEPDVLLLDEPFSAMDAHLREGLRLELRRTLADYGGIAVLVTHDRDEAYQLCSRIVLMESGRVLTSGDTRQVFADPGTVQAARMTGCKNISRIQPLNTHRVRALDWGNLELTVAGKVTPETTHIGIRAHDFKPVSAAEAGAEEGGINQIPTGRFEVSEMPFEWYVTLENGIWWKTEKDIHAHDPAGVVPKQLWIAPEKILMLSEV